MRRAVIIGLIGNALAGAPAPAQATAIELAFTRADTTGDMLLDVGEVVAVSIREFRLVDRNGDKLLQAAEVGELAETAEFSDNDADDDDALSMSEVVRERLDDFSAADLDGDRVLTLDEVRAFLEAR